MFSFFNFFKIKDYIYLGIIGFLLITIGFLKTTNNSLETQLEKAKKEITFLEQDLKKSEEKNQILTNSIKKQNIEIEKYKLDIQKSKEKFKNEKIKIETEYKNKIKEIQEITFNQDPNEPEKVYLDFIIERLNE